MIIAALVAAAYFAAPHRATSAKAAASWILGCAALAIAFSPPVEARAETGFTAHMVQHLLLVFVAAPLLALGRPVGRWLRVAPRRRGRGAGLVVAATVALIGVLSLSHVPAIYDAALRHPLVHLLEHGAYLYAGLAYWMAVADVDPLPRRPSHPHRIVALLALPPVIALIAAAIGSADHVLYPAQSATLADQRAGAALMWLGPMLVVVPAALLLVLDWARHEERTERRLPPSVTLHGPITTPTSEVATSAGLRPGP